MAKPKPSKKRAAAEKKKRSKAFNKTKELKVILGSSSSTSSSSTALMDRSATYRSLSRLEHDGDEEVFVVSNGSILAEEERSQFTRFSPLSSILPTRGTATVPDLEEQDQQDVGFFFDSTPSKPVSKDDLSPPPPPPPPPIVTKSSSTLTKYQKQKQKIIQDDSVYISDDDNASISNIEEEGDISMLQALQHWGTNDMLLFEDTPTKNVMTSDDEYYTMLEGTTLDDICMSSSSDNEEEEEEEEDTILLESDLSFDLLEVPESLKNSYRGMITQEKNRMKRQIKNQRNNDKRRMKKVAAATTVKQQEQQQQPRQNKNNLLDQILHEFIEVKDVEVYKLDNLNMHGRKIIIPKMAKLFQLQIESNKKNIVLKKTSKTRIPDSYKQRQKRKIKSKVTFKTRQGDRRLITRRNDMIQHGQMVAATSEPISSNNIGHRMLAAMGWKTGNAIGNRQDGIKEPIQVQIRANRRGLGA